jgi:hypothetical protein
VPVESRLAWKRRFEFVLFVLIDVVIAGFTARVLGQGFPAACLVLIGLQLLDLGNREEPQSRTGKEIPATPVSWESVVLHHASNLRVLTPRTGEDPLLARRMEGRAPRADARHTRKRARSDLRLASAP